MLFPEDEAPLLKKWIVKRLENTSDADADVLADYVLALLRHEGDIDSVRTLFLNEIPDFLQEDSEAFTRDVFDAITYRTYLPGNALPLPAPTSFAPPSGPSRLAHGNIAGGPPPFGPSQNGSRKRSYNDRSDSDSQDRAYGYGDLNGRISKQARRAGARGGFENTNGRGGFQGGRGGHMSMSQGRGFSDLQNLPNLPPGMQSFDPNNPLDAMLAMQAMGFPLPQFTAASGSLMPQTQSRKQRCRDYDQKGFCARGNTCNYEHGENSIYVPPGGQGDEYDPTNAGLMQSVENNGQQSNPNSHSILRGGDRGRGRSRGDRGGPHGNSGRRGGRAEFSSDRPNFDRTKTTIVVENIPEDKFSEDTVRDFFNEFGNIVDVSMRPYKRLAIVKYDDWNSANAAYKSPRVIFDNRFVKVYWFTDNESLPKPPAVAGSKSTALKSSATLNAARAPEQKSPEPGIDLEEFTRKQEEAQKAHEEKMKKKQEMENSRKELEKRQEDLLKSQAEEKRKLMERIAAKSAKSGITALDSAKPQIAISQTEALKAQLAALEAEAQSLGIDPAATEEPHFGGYRGRGRGRGPFRARGTYAARSYRGGYRGRGGATFAGGGAYKLDNRPKQIAVTGVDFTHAEKDESLRQFLLGIGEYTGLDITPSKTSITFKDRFTAEKFMYGLAGSEIPSVGKVDLAWVQTPLPPVTVPPKSEDLALDDGVGDAMASMPGPTETSRESVENLDYDVADDNDWAIE